MKEHVIERDFPAIGEAGPAELREAAQKSNPALAELAPSVQWIESYVTANKTFCIYLAEDEAAIRKHSELSGFPTNVIPEVKRMIDPTTAAAVAQLQRSPEPSMDARLQRRVQRYGWDLAADVYERGWRDALAPAHARLLERAALVPGERVIDVACGTGVVTFAAARS